ncbi:MAG: ribulose-phosphate 3-epimerase [Endozoicomonadaceae bacterium]|nr:ribulose-phosphate 3-epimerase [Endozoicomonadaceae bacterium]
MTPKLIAASILSANFAHLGNDIKTVLEAGADLIHFDVMDNHYVPNLSFGPMVLKSLKKEGIKAPFDVHLMVKPVSQLIEQFILSGADYITFHPEASEHIDRDLQMIKKAGCRAGLAFNPATPLHYLDYLIDQIDLILIMSVNPGFGGQQFIPTALDKLAQAKQRINASGRPILLEIDGGVCLDNISDIAQAGANVFVAGSAIFNTTSYQDVISNMRKKINQ